jgi:hypothetical protein
MTPQEQDLVNELFERLAKVESSPRDPNAERLGPESVPLFRQVTHWSAGLGRYKNALRARCHGRSPERSGRRHRKTSLATKPKLLVRRTKAPRRAQERAPAQAKLDAGGTVTSIPSYRIGTYLAACINHRAIERMC